MQCSRLVVRSIPTTFHTKKVHTIKQKVGIEQKKGKYWVKNYTKLETSRSNPLFRIFLTLIHFFFIHLKFFPWKEFCLLQIDHMYCSYGYMILFFTWFVFIELPFLSPNWLFFWLTWHFSNGQMRPLTFFQISWTGTLLQNKSKSIQFDRNHPIYRIIKTHFPKISSFSSRSNIRCNDSIAGSLG